MKAIAQRHSPFVGSLLAILGAVFKVVRPRHDAAQIEAAVAASGHPSGA